MNTNQNLLLFDGECKFCKTCIILLKAWKIRSDINMQTLQSLEKYNAQSLELYLDNTLYIKSKAIENCLKSCRNPIAWSLYFLLRLFPRPLKDNIYDRIAAKRRCRL